MNAAVLIERTIECLARASHATQCMGALHRRCLEVAEAEAEAEGVSCIQA